jgi:GNAT superfamily N-acetyltransferase
MAISVRRATADDAAAIAAVHVAGWEGAYRGLVPDAWFEERTLENRTSMWRRVLGDVRSAVVFVAEDGGTVVGLASAQLPSRDADADEDTAEISALYVDPDHWRAGAGRALMDALLAELSVRGFETATLWVFEANPRARAFYGVCGFVADGARQGEPPELRLRRSLP